MKRFNVLQLMNYYFEEFIDIELKGKQKSGGIGDFMAQVEIDYTFGTPNFDAIYMRKSA